jgi:TolA-binding protein
MTVDKILVIVVLVFSVVFVVAAISGYTKARDMSAGNEAKITRLNDEGQKKDVRVSELDATNKDLNKSLIDQASLIKSANDEREKAVSANTDLQGQITAKEKAVQDLQGKINDLNNTVTTLQGKVDELNKTLQGLIAERDKLKEDLRNANLAVDGLNGQLKTANDTITQQKVDLDKKDKEIAYWKAGGPASGQGPHEEVKLDCAILNVKRGEGYSFVALDKGGKAGLKVDMKMFVWNSAEGYKGKLTVIEVKDDTAFARIDWEEQGKQIKEGDTASVQNF